MSHILHDLHYSVQICHSLYNVTNKYSTFTVLSVTILFTVLMSDTLHDFPFYVETYHYLPSETNKQTNKQTAVFNVVLPFHTRCPTLSYQCTFHCHLRLLLPFPVKSKVTTLNALLY